MVSETEENYLKAIYKLSEKVEEGAYINTNAIAHQMNTKAASVTDMIKRLSEKKLLIYKKYKGVMLTESGATMAMNLIRKHRLWEVFLLEKLHFKWDEVHDLAEQLEHVQSGELTNRLDAFLGHPKYDPHGDPIPDKDGNIVYQSHLNLTDLSAGDKGVIVGVNEHTPDFLRYLEDQKLVLGTHLELIKCHEFDNSMELLVNQERTLTVSNLVSRNLTIKKHEKVLDES